MTATAGIVEDAQSLRLGPITYSFAAMSDPGKIRPKNEDTLLLNRELGLFGVCDGLGGHLAGEVASRLAAGYLQEHLLQEFSDPAEKILRDGIEKANRSIWLTQELNPQYRGMGTTLTSLWLASRSGPAQAWIGHIGDSRLYRLRGSGMEQLTEDHSPVFELFKLGKLTKEEMRHHPQRHILNSCLGIQEWAEPDVLTVSLAAEDLFLICSDGLTDLLGEEEVGHFATVDEPLPQRVEALVEEANRRGGSDNISVVLVHILNVTGTR